jgi:hypothetical protein
MLVVVFNGIDVTLHGGSRGALQREAGGTSGDTEVRNLAVGDIVHESCVRAVRWENTEHGCRSTYHGRTRA